RWETGSDTISHFHFSSSRSEEVDARRASAGQTEEFLADGYTAQQNVLPFAALFVSPCLGVRLV
ncbi:MAG: hypothetical protein ACK6DM_15185, partial [Alphaproteobacteria bacterium]